MSYLCERCGDEFEDHGQYRAHRSSCQKQIPEPPVTEDVKPSTPKTTISGVRKIELKTRYFGDCPDCSREVSTLEIKVGGKDVLVAYCVFCKKQLASQEAPELLPKAKPKREST